MQKLTGVHLMKIAILNGNPNADNVKFDDYLRKLSDGILLISKPRPANPFGLAFPSKLLASATARRPPKYSWL